MKAILVFLAALVLGGCSTMGEYGASLQAANEAQVQIAQAQAEATRAKYEALAQLAAGGDAAVKVAATMAIAMGPQALPTVQAIAPVPQVPAAERWAQIIANPLMYLLGKRVDADVAMHTSDNATRQALGQQQLMLGFGQAIQSGSTAGYPYINPTPIVAPDPVIVQTPAPQVVQIPTQVIEQPTLVQAPVPQ